MSFFRVKSLQESALASQDPKRHLKRSLGVVDLIVLGVAVAVGAGIFSVGAKAAAELAGPAVLISFVIAGLTCAMAMMCYAEFASAMPVAGSAYSYTYATLGEGIAWLVGWNIILELISAGGVIAKYWGIYLRDLLSLADIQLLGHASVFGISVDWAPAAIVGLVSLILARGIRISANINNLLTAIKLGVVALVIVAGFCYVDLANYIPFIPEPQPISLAAEPASWTTPLIHHLIGVPSTKYGIAGIFSGAALVFFAFIGFDVVAASSEEVRNPQRNIPIGILGGLAIVTVLYLLVSLTIVGMVPYHQLAEQRAPSLTTAFTMVGAKWPALAIATGALAGLSTVILVVIMGISRVLMAMSRDGLLPRSLSITSRHSAPVRLQLIAAAVIAGLASFTRVEALEEMINIGTLCAFVAVSIGVIFLRKQNVSQRGFRLPWHPWIPLASAVSCTLLMLNLSVLTWLRFAAWVAIGLAVYFLYGATRRVVPSSSTWREYP